MYSSALETLTSNIFAAENFMLELLHKGAFIALITGTPITTVTLFDLFIASICIFLAIKIYAIWRRRRALHPILRQKVHSKDEQLAKAILPEDFDADKFLEAAKISYAHIQDAWDKHDFRAMKKYTSPAMLRDMRQVTDTTSAPVTTEILLLEASLIDVQLQKKNLVLFVLFNALLREGALTDSPTKVQEIWCFIRKQKETEASWRLDEIQNIE